MHKHTTREAYILLNMMQGVGNGFFMGKMEPTSPWPEKLMAKFRADFGDSL